MWTFPAVFALHVLEEAPAFTEWARRHASERYTSDDFIRVNALGLALTTGTTLLVVRVPSRRLFLAHYAAVVTQQALFNPVFHAGTTVAFRSYSPGLLTSLLFVPLWWRLTRLGLRRGLLTRSGVLGASAVGGLVHGSAVARQVFFLEASSVFRRAPRPA